MLGGSIGIAHIHYNGHFAHYVLIAYLIGVIKTKNVHIT